MAAILKLNRFLLTAACLAVVLAIGAAVSPQSQPMLITLTGQSMIRSDIRATAPAAVPAIQSLIKGDVKFTNFEAAVAEKEETVSEGGGFLAPPEALDALTTVGFNLLSLSNNHAFDLKLTGLENTLREVNSRKIVHAGTGQNVDEATAPGYLHTSKGTVALVALASGMIQQGGNATSDRPGVDELRVQMGDKPNEARAELPPGMENEPNPEDTKRILQSIRNARQHADLVIVYQHNHVFSNKPFLTMFEEGLPERLAPNDWLKKWTHLEVDAGADIVVMHGAPLLHGVEIYHGKPIFYDLGNFIYNLPPELTVIEEPINWESVVAYVQFQGRNLQAITLQPIFLNNVGQGVPDPHNRYTNNQFLDTRGLPSPATGLKASYILQRMADLSKPFGTEMELKGDTAEIKVKGGS
ncbi:MAG: CapA family protein [Candidatus Acidiferrales bacterium]|jgi:poly-gamma-glutamate synthesis protein (capsule biosynthesis protein)